jgi:hypothetical protein
MVAEPLGADDLLLRLLAKRINLCLERQGTALSVATRM